MSYVAGDARREMLEEIGEAVDLIGRALASLGAAYEQVDEETGDRLEERIFRPVQVAYARLRRAHDGFAERFELPGRTFESSESGLPSTGVAGFVSEAVEAVSGADLILSELQDSMMPVNVGDAELRAGLSGVREVLADLPGRAHELLRTLGR